ncbi:hypothetical protein QAD02_022670, partial [Eretmocerus hayati]
SNESNNPRSEYLESSTLATQNQSRRSTQNSLRVKQLRMQQVRQVMNQERTVVEAKQVECSINRSDAAYAERVFDPIALLRMIKPVDITLSTCSQGKIILQNYKKRKILTEYERNKMVDIVVKDLFTLTP